METILANKELENISGGALHWAAIAGLVVGACAFVAGVFDGYLRPYGCRR